MRTFTSVALLIATVAGSTPAQTRPSSPATIDPGMTKEQVIDKLGKPLSEHSTGSWTYLYYRNGHEKTFGMSDLVTLDHEKVVDAIFRSPQHRFSGQSSSPAPVPVATAIARGHEGAGPPMAVPPAARATEPRKGGDTRKITAGKKNPDSTTKAPPAPVRKP
jgi:hypothetical protein